MKILCKFEKSFDAITDYVDFGVLTLPNVNDTMAYMGDIYVCKSRDFEVREGICYARLVTFGQTGRDHKVADSLERSK